MFWKWGGHDIKIYGNGVIESQGLVDMANAGVSWLTVVDNAGGMSLKPAQARELIEFPYRWHCTNYLLAF